MLCALGQAHEGPCSGQRTGQGCLIVTDPARKTLTGFKPASLEEQQGCAHRPGGSQHALRSHDQQNILERLWNRLRQHLAAIPLALVQHLRGEIESHILSGHQ